jgi:hypothetical protein
VIVRDGEGHELLQCHAVLGIDVEQLRRHGRKAQPLLHHRRRDEETGGNVLFRQALIAERFEDTELIERVKFGALRVLGEGILFGQDVGVRVAHHAGDERILGETLLLHEKPECAIPPPAGGHLEHAGLVTVRVENRPDAEALQ